MWIASLVTASSRRAGLEYTLVSGYEPAYADHGTSSRLDLGVWSPSTNCADDGWYA
jgi:hypothetical protein